MHPEEDPASSNCKIKESSDSSMAFTLQSDRLFWRLLFGKGVDELLCSDVILWKTPLIQILDIGSSLVIPWSFHTVTARSESRSAGDGDGTRDGSGLDPAWFVPPGSQWIESKGLESRRNPMALLRHLDAHILGQPT